MMRREALGTLHAFQVTFEMEYRTSLDFRGPAEVFPIGQFMNTELTCTCGEVRLRVEGKPILAAECHCNSCREAGARMGALPNAPTFLAKNGGTPFILCRKDRVAIEKGREHLGAFRLNPKTSTRRIVAKCCNTPVFLEFKGGHWMSVYSVVWPASTLPPMELRTMTSDLPDPTLLDETIPNKKHQSIAFFAKLLWAWAAMGFRAPDVDVTGEITA